MAEEITSHILLSLNNSGTSKRIASRQQRLTQTTAVANSLYHQTEQVVGTSEENLDVGDVTTPGLIYLRNTDGTNFISYGTVTTDLGFVLLPGEQNLVRLKSGETLIVQADTAECKLEIGLLAT